MSHPGRDVSTPRHRFPEDWAFIKIDAEWVPVHLGSLRIERMHMRDTEFQALMQEMPVLRFTSRTAEPGPITWFEIVVPISQVLGFKRVVPAPAA